jgi:putative ubiquitin-RnfH superfamily antitoxin RatB of RatAB toxin-antitoxin module
MVEADKLPVEVAYALPDKQEIVMLEVPGGTTAREAVRLSEMVRFFPDIDVEAAPIGIFGKVIEDDFVLRAGDRVEIYRPLIADPKEVRKKRAAQARERRAAGG